MQAPGLPSCILLRTGKLSFVFEVWQDGRIYHCNGLHTPPPFWANIFHDVLKSKLTSKINPSNLQLHKCKHTSHNYTKQVIFHIWPMLLGSVEASGHQHAHLTIWTIFPLNSCVQTERMWKISFMFAIYSLIFFAFFDLFLFCFCLV